MAIAVLARLQGAVGCPGVPCSGGARAGAARPSGTKEVEATTAKTQRGMSSGSSTARKKKRRRKR